MRTLVLLDLIGGRSAAALRSANGPEPSVFWPRASAFSLDGTAESGGCIQAVGSQQESHEAFVVCCFVWFSVCIFRKRHCGNIMGPD